MKLNRTYAAPADMPATIPLFPLEGALLLPRRPLQLTVFEPRYLAMLDDALSGERLIGIIQPTAPEMTAGPPPDLYPIGCAGRIVQYRRNRRRPLLPDPDGRRPVHAWPRRCITRRPTASPPADYAPFAEDFTEGAGEAAVDRDSLLATLRRFAEVNEVKVAWGDIKKASNEALVNGLSMMSPCGPREKQALLEAHDLQGARRDAGGDHHHRPRPRRRRGDAAPLATPGRRRPSARRRAASAK